MVVSFCTCERDSGKICATYYIFAKSTALCIEFVALSTGFEHRPDAIVRPNSTLGMSTRSWKAFPSDVGVSIHAPTASVSFYTDLGVLPWPVPMSGPPAGSW